MNQKFEMRLELVPVPVTDIDRSLKFYTEILGFNKDYDNSTETFRIVQLTPKGSACSILLSHGLPKTSEMLAGTVKGLLLVVQDLHTVREALIGLGLEIGEINEYPRGIKDAHFSDPDGNIWILQEIPANL